VEYSTKLMIWMRSSSERESKEVLIVIWRVGLRIRVAGPAPLGSSAVGTCTRCEVRG
jgi:hypothetical protein